MESRAVSDTEVLIQQALKFELSGDISSALRIARQALELANAGNQPVDKALALTTVARYRFRFGQYEAARELARKALAMTGPAPTEGTYAHEAAHAEALLLLGMCAAESESLAECEDYYRRAAELAREIGHKLLHQRALHNLASAVYLMRGQFNLAISADSLALQIARENQMGDWSVYALITLAIAFQLTGQNRRAQETLDDLHQHARPGSSGEGYYGYVKGMLALDEGHLSEALEQFTRARAIAEATGDPSLNLDLRLGLSRLYRLQGNSADARGWAEDALRLAHRLGYRIYQGRTLVERSRAAWLNGDGTAAQADLRQALTLFSEMEMGCDLAETQLLLAAVLFQLDDPQAASFFTLAAGAIQRGGYEFILEREHALVYPLVAAYLDSPVPELAGASAILLERIQRMPPRPLKMVTLGKMELWVGGRLVDSRVLRQRRAGEVLALLLSSPGYSLSSDQVTEAICPEKEPRAALNFYHHAISALRRLLEPDLPDRRFFCRYLDVNDERINLIVPPGSFIDFQELEAGFQNRDWEKVAALYGGEFLPMCCYTEWTIAPRQHLADLVESALLALAESKLEAGEFAACLSLARRALQQNSWQEQAVELGMRAAVQLGDRTTALRLYQRLEKVLNEELGVDPQIELQQLYSTLHKQTSRKI